MTLKGIVFDLDQTLYDRNATDLLAMAAYYASHRESFAEDCSLQKAQSAMLIADHDNGHFGWNRILDSLKAQGLFKTAPSADDICSCFQEQYALHGVLYPSTLPMFEGLKELGLKTGLITNGKTDGQMGKVKGMGLERCFDRICIGCDKATAKPHPDLFLEMAGNLGCKPEELLYVGDHPVNDIQASRLAGYTPIWIRTMPWDYPEVEKPELQIDDLSELLVIAGNFLSHGRT